MIFRRKTINEIVWDLTKSSVETFIKLAKDWERFYATKVVIHEEKLDDNVLAYFVVESKDKNRMPPMNNLKNFGVLYLLKGSRIMLFSTYNLLYKEYKKWIEMGPEGFLNDKELAERALGRYIVADMYMNLHPKYKKPHYVLGYLYFPRSGYVVHYGLVYLKDDYTEPIPEKDFTPLESRAGYMGGVLYKEMSGIVPDRVCVSRTVYVKDNWIRVRFDNFCKTVGYNPPL